MAEYEDRFWQWLHPVVHEVIEKNNQNEKSYGHHDRWDWDHESVTLTFSDPVNATLRIAVTVVGSTEANSWQWSWANRNWDNVATRDMEKVRRFGEESNFVELTSPFLEAEDCTGWDMTAAAAHVLDALGSYRFPTDDGFCYLIYRHIEQISTPFPSD